MQRGIQNGSEWKELRQARGQALVSVPAFKCGSPPGPACIHIADGRGRGSQNPEQQGQEGRQVSYYNRNLRVRRQSRPPGGIENLAVESAP